MGPFDQTTRLERRQVLANRRLGHAEELHEVGETHPAMDSHQRRDARLALVGEDLLLGPWVRAHRLTPTWFRFVSIALYHEYIRPSGLFPAGLVYLPGAGRHP